MFFLLVTVMCLFMAPCGLVTCKSAQLQSNRIAQFKWSQNVFLFFASLSITKYTFGVGFVFWTCHLYSVYPCIHDLKCMWSFCIIITMQFLSENGNLYFSQTAALYFYLPQRKDVWGLSHWLGHISLCMFSLCSSWFSRLSWPWSRLKSRRQISLLWQIIIRFSQKWWPSICNVESVGQLISIMPQLMPDWNQTPFSVWFYMMFSSSVSLP